LSGWARDIASPQPEDLRSSVEKDERFELGSAKPRSPFGVSQRIAIGLPVNCIGSEFFARLHPFA
jgi:hypothetical protein